jgi:hypothetical protein
MRSHRGKLWSLAITVPLVVAGEFIGPALAGLAVISVLLIWAFWR